MGNAITHDARALWLMLRKDGGWWSASMLTHHWRPTFDIYEMNTMLNALVAGGIVQSRKQVDADQYCVTSDCLELPGTTLTDE